MPSEAFEYRILNDLLPAFCNHPHRSAKNYHVSGFKPNFSAIDDIDAENFLKAMDAGLVSPVERRRRAPLYEAPQSRAGEQLFWEHDKNAIPRPLTLWIEPIITIATLSTLHFDFGWPRELLGTQSVDWAFDVAAYVASDLENEYIACEVKKTVEEVDRLVESMRKFGALSADDAYEAKKRMQN